MRRLLLLLALLACVSCDDLVDDTASAGICPDETDPCVHYESDDPSECSTLDFICDDDQTGFTGPCGCGCLDSCRR